MSRSNRGLLAAILIIGAGVILLGRSVNVVAQPAGDSSDWVKVGQYRINGDNINYIYDDGHVLHVHFITAQSVLTLKGAEVDPVRRWIDARAADPAGAGRRPAAPAAR